MVAITWKARPYQARGVQHLLQHPAGGLLQDPGTGKTAEVLAAYHILRARDLVDGLIVVAPLRPVYEVWPAEIEKWGFPFATAILHGGKKTAALDAEADIYLLNYDGLSWFASNASRLLKRRRRWWIAFDESTKIKHTNTQRFKALRPLLPLFTRRTILTGTPAPNGLMDLFGQVYAVDLGASLGRYVTQYRREFFYPSGYGGYTWILQPDAEARIYERLDGLFYRVSDEVLKLPPRHDVPLYVRLPPAAQRVYAQLEAEFVVELRSGVVTAVNAGVLSSKLRQVANGGLYDGKGKSHAIHHEKVDAVVDLVEQLQGNPLLVGYEFTSDAARLSKKLDGAPIVGGGTSPKEASALFKTFNAGRLPALLCQSGAAAHGLNLQEACHTIALFGLPWNLETYQQFSKRVHRSGQRRSVTVHHVIARNTIDETVWQVLRQKDKRQAALLTAIKRRYA